MTRRPVAVEFTADEAEVVAWLVNNAFDRGPRPIVQRGRLVTIAWAESPVNSREIECPGHRANDPRAGRHPREGADMAERTCSIDGCERPHWARGLCGKHHSAARRRGELVPLVRPHWLDVFWSRVDRQADGCWRWTGTRHRTGYGRFKMPDREQYAHRISYVLANGVIPDGLELDHLCRNHWCVNPDHLEAVTHRENVLRGVAPERRRQSRLSHCHLGHPYDEENTYVRPNGKRKCRACDLIHGRKNRRLASARRKLAAARVAADGKGAA